MANDVDVLMSQVVQLRYALKAFVDYYDQAGIGPLVAADEHYGKDGFDGDTVFNVRMGRRVLKETRPKRTRTTG